MARKRNAPLKGARAIGANMTEVEHGDLTILYSYKTPVAFLSPKGGYRTEQQWSKTTSGHISKFFNLHGYDFKGAFKIPRDDLERFVEAGSLAGSVMGAGRVTRSNPKDDPFQHDPDEAYPDPGKFEGETWLAVQMYEAAMESGAEEEGGDSTDGPGYFWLFTDFEASDGPKRHGILEESGQGFVSLTEYDTARDASEAWENDVEPVLEEWDDAQGEG